MGNQHRWMLATKLTAAVTVLLLVDNTRTTNADAGFASVASSRATMSAADGVMTVHVVNLGHCCALCEAQSSCTVVNYLEAMHLCQLLSTTVPGVTTTMLNDPTSRMLIKFNYQNASDFAASQMQPVAGVLVQSGRAEGCTNYTMQNVSSATHCWRLCSALTGGTCRLFAHHASRLTCLVFDVDFYDTWTAASSSDPGWTSYYAKKTSSWKLLYKISKGSGVDASNAFLVGPSNSTASSTHTALSSTCNCYVRSAVLDNWSKFPITSVMMVLANGGASAKSVTFSINSNDTPSTFFTVSKIVDSSWTDLNSTTAPKRMAMGTPSNNYAGRYFIILKDCDVSCNTDSGWLSVNGLGSAACSYDAKPVPQFAYSSGLTATYLSSAVFADALLIYARM